jgi:hypothetical protein
MGFFENIFVRKTNEPVQSSSEETGPQIRKATSLELIHTDFSKTADNGKWFFNTYFEKGNFSPDEEIVFSFEDKDVDGLDKDLHCHFPCKIRRSEDDHNKYFGIVYASKNDLPTVEEWLSKIMHADIISEPKDKEEEIKEDNMQNAA